MHVMVDGIIYQLQARGGITKIFNEILPRMCAKDPSLEVTLFTDGTSTNNLPKHSKISSKRIPPVSRIMRPERMWRHLMPGVRQHIRRLWIGKAEGKIWHTTYYTSPEEKRIPRVVSVYDMIFERYPDLFRGRVQNILRNGKNVSWKRMPFSAYQKRHVRMLFVCVDWIRSAPWSSTWREEVRSMYCQQKK